MARRSPHFFAQQPAGPANNAQASKTQQKYLETMLNKLAKEKNQVTRQNKQVMFQCKISMKIRDETLLWETLWSGSKSIELL